MTQPEQLYLGLVIVAFTVFALVLAYQSHRQKK